MVKVKLDLHTHVWEAFGFGPPTPEMARQVIAQVKRMGIDGIAVTDHRNKEFAFAFAELVDREFPGQILVIPGWEIEVRVGPGRNDEYQVAELFLPGERVFRCYCHPGHPLRQIVVNGVHAIEVSNLGHNWHINREEVLEVARRHNLLLFSVSDAHRLEDIGKAYTEVDMEELLARGQPGLKG
ncbi:MAG: PHP domain-containing protein [Chloroflexi bacterium]|nr:PHP domain-containing protein [Chloroflexota bacterium]